MPPETRAQHRHARGAGAHVVRPRRRRWPWIVAAAAVLVGALATVTTVFVLQLTSVRDDLTAAKSQARTITKSATSGDTAKLNAAGAKILALTARADDTAHGSLWDIAGRIPLLGPNVVAVQRAAEAGDILARGAVSPGLEVLGGIDLKKLVKKGGGIDLTPLTRANEALPGIDAALQKARTKLATVDTDAVLPDVRTAVTSLTKLLDKASPVLSEARTALPPLLALAGADGPRTYMLIFQNNAEARASGGVPAATAIVDVDAGKVKLGDQTDTQTFRRAGTAGHQYLDLPEQTLALYEPDTFKNHGNFTRTPNFPTTAKAFDALWLATTGAHLDGVVSIDPVALSSILSVTGPITLGDGRKLTAANAVETLLYDTYHRYPSTVEQDLFFADVASRVFAKVAGGGWNAKKMLTQLTKLATQHRLSTWFSRPDEQKLAVTYHLDGAMASDNRTTTQVGIFVNDAAYSKLEYFLRSKATVTCDAAARTVTTTLSIANTTPEGAMTSYQLGIRNKQYGIARDTFILDVLGFAPPGATIVSTDPQIGDIPSAHRVSSEDGRAAQSVRILVPRGETRTVSFTSRLPSGKLGHLSLRQTPGVTGSAVSIAKTCAAMTSGSSK